ncbi:MAG: hypothetical protein NT105_01565 [Verrucomicrobia bacterium]|nr:hypothetical protein [Verrucomicrobiota bacterium]
MQLQLKLVHDGITPHLNRIAAALGRPTPILRSLSVFRQAKLSRVLQEQPQPLQPKARIDPKTHVKILRRLKHL